MHAVPIADAPNVKIAKSLKYPSQKLEIRWVIKVCTKKRKNACLYVLIFVYARYSGTKAISVNIGFPNKEISFGIAAERIMLEKME